MHYMICKRIVCSVPYPYYTDMRNAHIMFIMLVHNIDRIEEKHVTTSRFSYEPFITFEFKDSLT